MIEVINREKTIEVPSKWEIPLTQGLVALVDEEDFACLNEFNWHAREDHKTFYAARRYDYGFLLMHRVIARRMHILNEYYPEVDHIDRNGLNNQRSNLRAANRSLNRINSVMPKRVKTASQFIGVVYINGGRKKPWKVQCQGEYLGHFADEVDAAKAYDKRAKKVYGEFARTNF